LTINEVKVLLPKIIRYRETEDFVQLLKGRQFLNLERRGKYLLAHLSDGWTLVVHLGMTGRLIYCAEGLNGFITGDIQNTSNASDSKVPRHVHAILTLDDGGLLIYHDLRQFGYLTVCPTAEFALLKGLCRLGPEPLGEEFKLEALQTRLKGRKVRIKQLLLDQGLIAGIGNIYADEILFEAGLHPEKTGASLTLGELEVLYQSIRKVLQKGIELRGTSISDYVDGVGQPGEFQDHLQVYQRTGLKCHCCSSIIQRVKVGGRSTHYCPQCQGEINENERT
jgi:formamidopyrimidine-DNA glycosylase